MAVSHFDWGSLMRAGVLGLGLSPDEFWRLTPAELQLMLGDPKRRDPLLKSGLDALMAAYPDSTKERRNDE